MKLKWIFLSQFILVASLFASDQSPQGILAEYAAFQKKAESAPMNAQACDEEIEITLEDTFKALKVMGISKKDVFLRASQVARDYVCGKIPADLRIAGTPIPVKTALALAINVASVACFYNYKAQGFKSLEFKKTILCLSRNYAIEGFSDATFNFLHKWARFSSDMHSPYPFDELDDKPFLEHPLIRIPRYLIAQFAAQQVATAAKGMKHLFCKA